MRFKQNVSSRMGVAGELLEFFWGSKWWWLTPMIFVLLLFAGLVMFGQSSTVAPFIYALF
jgi:hypothetical protein